MLELKDVIVLVPKSIKLEILKEEMKRIYLEEIETIKYIKQYDIVNIRYYIEHMSIIIGKPIVRLYDSYKALIEAVKSANLTEEEIKNIYLWCKKTRQELGLKDNLFNLDSAYIDENKNTYEKINQKINKLNNF